MPKIYRRKPIPKGELVPLKPLSGSQIVSSNQANTRKYARVIPEGLEPLMQKAYRLLNEKKFRKPGSIKTMQRKNTNSSRCYKAAWLDDRRNFDEDRCLLFPGFVEGRRVRVKYNYRSMSAAEAMLLMSEGLPPENHVVAHKCGNGHLSCVNPKHLYWATNSQNARDRVLHDYSTPPITGVSAEVVDEIRGDTRLNAVIAWDYGIPVAQVAQIKAEAAD